MSRYLDGVPRVTQIVEYFYPFKGTQDEEFYLTWLKKNNIEEVDYNNEAKDIGTMVHKKIEDYIHTGKKTKVPNKIKTEYEEGIKIVNYFKRGGYELKTEMYLVDKEKRFQGTADLVALKGNRCTIIDWKTWGIAKKKWNIEENYNKPYKKIDKTFLQLSFYAYVLREMGYDIEEIVIVWLGRDKHRMYDKDAYPHTFIEDALKEFYSDKNNIIINYGDMIIEIRKPTEQFGYIQVQIDMYNDDSGKTTEELVQEGVNLVNTYAPKLR